MQNRIFKSIFFTALVAVLIIGCFTAHTFYDVFDDSSVQQLKSEVESLAEALSRVPDAEDYLASLPERHRITLVATDGKVLFDSDADVETLDNHSDRPEIIEAARDGRGQSYRRSDTLTEMTRYYALRLDDGNILRLSITHSSLLGMFDRVLLPFFVVLVLTAALALGLSRTLARNITAPLQQIDLAEPLKNDAYDELTPILNRLQDQNEELRLQLRELTRQQQELSAITDNMREGLIILDRDGTIISINKSAGRIFSSNPAAAGGKNILTLNRSPEMREVFHDSQNGQNGEAVLHLNGRSYQLLSTPVTGQKTSGSVILVLDATSRLQAEEERRDFSANVSHELRTPLTAIVGYSEIMSNGLAKPEDMKPFAEKIHAEAQRLMQLINDIIELSRLDEKAQLPEMENVPLMPLCENVVARLRPAAEAKDISIMLRGDNATVRGIPRLLDEISYNLIQNAVKYNKPGGSVTVTVTQGSNAVVLSVSDTGVGIPIEHQPRIFERFYRVDRSHSKETGGTGLGLAIVKHAAEILSAKIDLQSTAGEGSTFTLTFPVR